MYRIVLTILVTVLALMLGLFFLLVSARQAMPPRRIGYSEEVPSSSEESIEGSHHNSSSEEGANEPLYEEDTDETGELEDEDFSPIPAPSSIEQMRGIQQGYRSASYNFLETRTPTDTLPENSMAELSRPERMVLEDKKRWLSSPFPSQLAAIVEKIIEDRRDSPIMNAVCLGIGSGYWSNQFLVFSQVVSQLSIAYPDILKNITVQDPAITKEHRLMFINHGCKVVETPAAFALVNANTFLMSNYLCSFPGWRGRGIIEIGLFIGNGDDLLMIIEESPTDGPEFAIIFGNLLDEDLSSHQDVPTDRAEKSYSGGGSFDGLAGLDIWWRPVRSQVEELAILYDVALTLGFPKKNVREFEKAFASGFSEHAKSLRDQIVCMFVAAHRDGNDQPFHQYYPEYYAAFQEGRLDDKTRLYEDGFKRWKSIIQDPEEEDRSWKDYVKGKRWIGKQPKELTEGWNKPVPTPHVP